MKGKVFGLLTVLEKASKRDNGEVIWSCHCECGRIKPVRGTLLREGRIKSCGCNQHGAASRNKVLFKQWGIK